MLQARSLLKSFIFPFATLANKVPLIFYILIFPFVAIASQGCSKLNNVKQTRSNSFWLAKRFRHLGNSYGPFRNV